MNNTSYAVDTQTGHFTQWKPDSLAAAWYCFVFFRNMWLSEPHVPEKTVPFHPAGGEAGQLSRQTPGFGTDRVTPVNKNGIFRPAGGEIRFRVSDRVTCVKYTTYALTRCGLFQSHAGPESRLRRQQHGTFCEKESAFSVLLEAKFPSEFATV